MSDTTTLNLADYVGKRVTFQYLKEGADGERSEVEIEGTVDLVNGPAMLLKPRGAIIATLIELEHIVPGTFEVVPEKPRELKSKRIDPVTLSNARAHLADRHSFTLSVLNNCTDERAYELHNKIDHADLGHHHATREVVEVSGDITE